MAKVLFPRNIEKGLFSTLSFSIGPFTVNMIQLLVLAVGLAGFLGIFQIAQQSGMNRVLAVILWLPVLIVFVIIAFFKVSELSLIPFLAKVVRTYFFDTIEKFQVNFPKDSKVDMLLKKHKYKEKKDTIEHKEREQAETDKKIERMQSSGLL